MESEPKRSHGSESAEIIGGNEDLVTELILVYLPPRSLARFKSVCKQWLTLISTPLFAAAHTNHHSRRRLKSLPSFLLRTSAATPEFFYLNPTTRTLLPFKFEFPHTRILQSSHGLLLLEHRNTEYGRRNYCVYNPTTRQSRKLAVSGADGKTTSPAPLGLSLYFDPSKSPHYKVISFTKTAGSQSQFNLTIGIYDSESHNWEEIAGAGNPDISPANIKFFNGISWNNGIYWIRPTSRSHYFNLETRNLIRLPNVRIPRQRGGELNKNYIVESNGHAHCVCTYLGTKLETLTVHELSEHGNSVWFEKYLADLSPISSAMPEIKGLIRVLGIVRGDKEEDSSVLLHIPGMIISYSFYDRVFEVLCNFRNSRIYRHNQFQFKCNFSYQFIESLACV
ncbi:hypothetical protein ABFS82_10G140000 [Erythranthe guttata]|uniref:F-box protein At5g07610-like n=1 Tax=Erythranthe guttata TaxID=4155 RepID=UPI00064D80A0|nr:PREDICTED: F-box protein At5g07610-like [Erythranthe guttata]|eukprot:XP_012837571.1 PREDICTED: F-box protein At5g07610-like [Erythranthe guttata]